MVKKVYNINMEKTKMTKVLSTLSQIKNCIPCMIKQKPIDLYTFEVIIVADKKYSSFIEKMMKKY